MAYQTPYFVIDENQLTKDFQMLKSSLETSWGNYRIGYSFKTNSLPWLVTFLKAGGVMAEVVSDDEYSLAGALGFSNSEIVYNGPVKKRPSFERVLLAGGILNMDGRRELDWMEAVSYTHLRAHETRHDLVCRLLLEKKKNQKKKKTKAFPARRVHSQQS